MMAALNDKRSYAVVALKLLRMGLHRCSAATCHSAARCCCLRLGSSMMMLNVPNVQCCQYHYISEHVVMARSLSESPSNLKKRFATQESDL